MHSPLSTIKYRYQVAGLIWEIKTKFLYLGGGRCCCHRRICFADRSLGWGRACTGSLVAVSIRIKGYRCYSILFSIRALQGATLGVSKSRIKAYWNWDTMFICTNNKNGILNPCKRSPCVVSPHYHILFECGLNRPCCPAIPARRRCCILALQSKQTA